MKTLLFTLIGFIVLPPTRDERGLSQSTENAILLAGAVSVAIAVITAVTLYVTAKLPKP
jgi:branched-subunit amino acid transport protein